MQLARVEGSVTATICHPSLHGQRHLLCQPLDAQGNPEGTPIIAIDCHGAGMHQQVIVSSDGKATRQCIGHEKSPLRYLVIGVADSDEPLVSGEALPA